METTKKQARDGKAVSVRKNTAVLFYIATDHIESYKLGNTRRGYPEALLEFIGEQPGRVVLLRYSDGAEEYFCGVAYRITNEDVTE